MIGCNHTLCRQTFGSALNAHLHFHCVVVDGVFASTPTGGAVFHPATAIDRLAVATVQAKVRRRLLASFVRRGLLADDDAQAMAQWAHGGGFFKSTPRCASRPPTAPSRERLLRYGARPPLALERLREFDAELLCPLCGAQMQIVAFLTEPTPVRAILVHLGEPIRPPIIAPPRGPPIWDIPDAERDGFDSPAQPAPAYPFDQRLAW